MPSNLEIRARALEATMHKWKDRSFQLGKNDCFKLMVDVLKGMGINLPNTSKVIGYKTPLAARATLKRVYGVKSMPELLDKFFSRITPAQALPGDIICAPGFEEGTLGAVGIYYGNDLMICYEEEHDAPVIGRITYDEGYELTAWRTLA